MCGTLRHHRLLEVGPTQPRHVPAVALMEVVEVHRIGLEAVMAAIGKIELDNFSERAAGGQAPHGQAGRIPACRGSYERCHHLACPTCNVE